VEAMNPNTIPAKYSPWTLLGSKYTLIESPTGIIFDTVGTNGLAVRAGGSVTNLVEGGILFEITSGTVSISNSNWQTTNNWTVNGLMPNTQYTLSVRTKNGDGVMNNTVSGTQYSIFTYCVTPMAPILTNGTTCSVTVAVNDTSNPTVTQYLIAVTSSNWVTTSYVTASGAATVGEVWLTKAQIGSSITNAGLVSSVQYKYKVMARNQSGVRTAYSSDSSMFTLGLPKITCVTHTENVWSSTRTVVIQLESCNHYHYKFNQSATDYAMTTDPVASSSTINYTIPTEGIWYFQVRGEDASNNEMGTRCFGPICYDGSVPVISKVSAQYSASDTTVIKNDEWTDHVTPYFMWTAPASVSGIAGYSYTYGTDNTAPDNTLETASNFYEPAGDQIPGTYYLNVKALNNAGTWSTTSTFIYMVVSTSTVVPGVDNTLITGLCQTPDGCMLGVDPCATPGVEFSVDMDTVSLANSTQLLEVMTNTGLEIMNNVPGDAECSTLRRVEFVPKFGLKKGYTYELLVAATARNSWGRPLGYSISKRFTVIYDSTLDNTVIGGDNGGTRVELPPNTLGSDGYVEISTIDATQFAVANSSVSTGDPFSYPLVVREFTAYNASNVIQSTFTQSLTITIPYADADNDGIVDGSNPAVEVNTLAIYWYNPAIPGYEKLVSYVDTINKVLTASVSHFSTFVIMGSAVTDVGGAYAYPVPYRPAKQTGVAGITFKNLPSICSIKIYTISGELVTTISETSGTGSHPWDTTIDGSKVASGVYIYVIEWNGKKKIGKLMIIR